MTHPTATDRSPLEAFAAALPDATRRRIHPTQALAAHIAAATRRGWTPTQLATEAMRDHPGGLANPAGLITYRMQQAADLDPPTKPPPRLPLCGNCDQGFILDPATNMPTARCQCRTKAVK